MKSLVIKLEPEVITDVCEAPVSAREKAAAYFELTKPRITFLIVLTAAAGYFLGATVSVGYASFIHAMVGIALLSSGIAALNQFMERELDGLMRRTAGRPLPSGKLSPVQAFVFGALLTLAAEAYLAVFVNLLTAGLGVFVIAGYLLMYTPLKTRTSLSTVIGAFPGAMPPLMGWTAAAGEVGMGAWILFAILFLWQFPHFLAIAWLYREDYGRAGVLMLPVVEPDGRLTAQQIVLFTLLLIPVSLFPTLIGMSGKVYFYSAIVLGALFLVSSVMAAVTRSNRQARMLLLASVLYLPLLFAVMVINQ